MQSMKSYIYSVLFLGIFLTACNGNKPTTQVNAENKTETNTTSNTTGEIKISKVEFEDDKKKETTTPISNGKMDTVTVSTLEDLVAKTKSNRVMYLESGEYELEKDKVYHMTKDACRIIDKTKEETRSIGGQMYYREIDNFHLIGKKGTVIKSKNPLAIAFYVVHTKNFKVTNVIVKKDEPGNADLCYISNSQDVVIDKCKFDGGGTYGMYINSMNGIKIKNSTISRAHNAAVRLLASKGVEFINTTITQNVCTVPIIMFYGAGSAVTMNNVKIIDNKRNLKETYQGSERIFGVPNDNTLLLDNCEISNNEGFTSLGVNSGNVQRSRIDGVSI